MTVQKRGFVFILAGFQSLLYFCTPQSIILYPLFCRPSFISRALLFSHSLTVSRSLPLLHRDSFFFFSFLFFSLLFYSFILYCTVTVAPGSKHITHPTLNCPSNLQSPASYKPPSSKHFLLPFFLFLLPSFLPLLFLPFPPPPPPFYPTGLEIVPLFLTSVLLGD